MIKIFFVTIVCITTISCTPKLEEINYGKDPCSFCSMTIVDNKFAAQYVTNKGRAYKFDAIECLIHDMKVKKESDMAFIMVCDFSNPGVLIEAQSANFIVAESISSPMGANLLAVKEKNSVREIDVGTGAKQYNWSDICIKLQD